MFLFNQSTKGLALAELKEGGREKGGEGMVRDAFVVRRDLSTGTHTPTPFYKWKTNPSTES